VLAFVRVILCKNHFVGVAYALRVHVVKLPVVGIVDVPIVANAGVSAELAVNMQMVVRRQSFLQRNRQVLDPAFEQCVFGRGFLLRGRTDELVGAVQRIALLGLMLEEV
jgi:hypothetical protein